MWPMGLLLLFFFFRENEAWHLLWIVCWVFDVDPADVGVGIGLTLFSIVMTLSLYVQFLVNQWLESYQKEIKCFRSPQ